MLQGTFRHVVDPATAAAYRAAGWWGDETLADHVERHAAARPDVAAYVGDGARLTWSELHAGAADLAGRFVAAGVAPGDRLAVWLPDGPLLHLAYLAAEHAGATVVGIGSRVGRRELAHLLGRTGAEVLVSLADHLGQPTAEVVAALAADGLVLRHLVLADSPTEPAPTVDGVPIGPRPLRGAEARARRLGPDDLFLVNSTSGTTGLPKLVTHTQNRWRFFHQQAAANGALSGDDVVLAAVPAPFGFGIWTSHVTPMTLGATTVLLERFSPEAAFAAIEAERATVLCCVSTQFIMMLGSPELDRHDLSSLRVMFTGGEPVPYERALDFERRTGAAILQFYGSNETGLLSGTTLDDPPERRLRTAGRLIPEMRVRLLDGDADVTDLGRGQPACRGPATSPGYLDDPDADAELFTDDGWMRMGDICEVDADGWLSVVGRTSDFIIRGGKNISAPQVEADLATHPAIGHVAVVAMPDAVFGERVCAYAQLVPGAHLTLAELTEHLAAQGVSKELFPERLVVLDELPRSSGAKVAKGTLREDIARRLADEAARTEHVGGR